MVDPEKQVHDFEPGIAPSGLFWTVPIDPSAIEVSSGSGRARLHATNVAVEDYHDFFNAISPSPTSVPSHVSFDVRWAGGGERQKIRDETFGFAGQYVTGDASIGFSARQDGSGVVYTSDPGGQTTVSAGVGHEHNGVFFP